MKTAALAIALLLGGAAVAQSDTMAGSAAYDGDGQSTAAFETEGTTGSESSTTLAGAVSPAGAQLVQPSNSDPEHDARGIAVISDPAVVPAGWNGTAAGEAMGGPLLDPVSGEPAAETSYPACTRTVTDNCLQTYEKGLKD